MASGDPWSLIRWNRRFFFALPLVFALGVALGSFLFPTLRPDQLMERIAIPLVVGGWILILWPTPCPRCRQCFPIWNLPNWGYWPRWTLQTRPNVDGAKPAIGSGRSSECVVARSLQR